MTPIEYKDSERHFFLDEDGEYHGLYQSWYDNGAIRLQAKYNHGKWHGEYLWLGPDASVLGHRWYEYDELILNFSGKDPYPTTKEELLIFKLTYQGEFIPK